MTAIYEKLTWNEIVEKYPDKWVALKDIKWKDESNVESAVLVAISMDADELLLMQVNKEVELVEYTTPDNCCQLGMIEVH